MSLRPWICLLCLLFSIAAVSAVPGAGAKDEKLKPEQLIEKHLASIGSPEALKGIKTRIVQGTSHVVWRVGGQANLDGQGTILSDGESIRVGFKYPALDYPGEQFASDGNKVGVAKINPARRSNLGDFVYLNDEMLREGLLFGTFSTSWALFNQRDTKPKLELNGPKKVNGLSVYELKFSSKRNNGNVTTFLYFDAATFRHVRSEFKSETLPVRDPVEDSSSSRGGGSARGGGGTTASDVRGETIRTTIIEQFDDFKAEDGLTLPHSYKMDFSIDSPRGGFVGTWTLNVTQVLHNQPIDKQLFTIN